MPYPNEHSARLLNPNMEHIRVRRTDGSGKGRVQGVIIPETISVIWYIIRRNGEEIPLAQALRFPIKYWGKQGNKAKEWLKNNKIEFQEFEEAEIEKNDALNKEIKIEKMNEERQLIYGVVLVPNEVDTQGDWVNAEEIEKACHKFMENYQQLGIQHRLKLSKEAKIVENYIAPVDFTVKDQKIIKGSWVLVVHVLDKDLWSFVKEGKISSFSIGGEGVEA